MLVVKCVIIGVNLLPLRIDGGGTRHFAESLLLELTQPPFHERHLLLMFCQPALREHVSRLFSAACNVVIVEVGSESGLACCAEMFDVYFCPLNALSPVLPSCPSVACLMDVQERFYPQFFTPQELELRAELYSKLIHEATLACTISDFCAQTFVEKLAADPACVRVVRLCPQKRLLDARPLPPADCPENFMLYPANWYVHKNVRNLVSGYLRALQEMPALPDLMLVGHPMAGGRTWFDEVVAGSPSARKVHVCTEISPEELRGVYERARFVVLPTLFEGYCMPLAEAIAFGRPVLANDLPVMREIGGDWPVYAKLETPEQIAEALVRFCTAPAAPLESKPQPPALADWSWAKIAAAYETIFNQALIRHRLAKIKL